MDGDAQGATQPRQQWAQAARAPRDTLDREFIETGINALQPLSSTEVTPPGWMSDTRLAAMPCPNVCSTEVLTAASVSSLAWALHALEVRKVVLRALMMQRGSRGLRWVPFSPP